MLKPEEPWGEWQVTATRYGVSFRGEESILKLDCGDGIFTNQKPLNYIP